MNLISLLAWTISGLGLAAIQSHAQSTYEPYTFTTLGRSAGYGSLDGTGSAARFNQPTDLAIDSAGNVYVVDQEKDRAHGTIRKVTPAGVVTTLAVLYYPFGVGVDSAGNVYVTSVNFFRPSISKVTPAGLVTTPVGLVDVTGSAAQFAFPASVVVDPSGNIYVADAGNNTIREVTPPGVVTALAGLAGSSGVAVDSAGNFYVVDNTTIQRVTPAGVVKTLAGLAGNQGSADGTGSDARFSQPHGVAVDSAGNIYVADTENQTIRKVTPGGVVTTLAGLAGAFGSRDGTGSAARFNYPYGVAVNSAGDVYVSDLGDLDSSPAPGNAAIRKVTSGGVVTTLAGLAGNGGSADGTGSAERFNGPSGVAVDSAGNVYVADTYNNTIRKVTPAGVLTTLAGLSDSSGSADGTGSAARFNQPFGVAVDSAGNVYVADGVIRQVTPAGVVTTLAGLRGTAVAVDTAGNLYLVGGNSIEKATPVGTNWMMTTLAGLPPQYDDTGNLVAGGSGSADGTGSAARFDSPFGVAVDSAGNVYVADTYNSTIRKVTPSGVVTTLAGVAQFDENGYPVVGSADGTGSASRFYQPFGVAVDSAGNVYVADTYNSTIRKVTAAGEVTTLAGLADYIGSADGTGSAALLWKPRGMAVDSAGNVYVADTANNTIRKGYPENVPAVIVTSAPGFGFNAGQFGFNLTGPAGRLVIVEASADLVSWLPLWTNTFTGALNFSDPQSGVYSNRFYRARLP